MAEQESQGRRSSLFEGYQELIPKEDDTELTKAYYKVAKTEKELWTRAVKEAEDEYRTLKSKLEENAAPVAPPVLEEGDPVRQFLEEGPDCQEFLREISKVLKLVELKRERAQNRAESHKSYMGVEVDIMK